MPKSLFVAFKAGESRHPMEQVLFDIWPHGQITKKGIALRACPSTRRKPANFGVQPPCKNIWNCFYEMQTGRQLSSISFAGMEA